MEEVEIQAKDVLEIEESTVDGNTFLKEWLPTQNKKIQEITLPPLSGDINLALLHEHGFDNIKTLFFTKGNIHAIRNIPLTVKTLDIRHNKVKQLDSLPTGIEYLYASHNNLSEIDLYDCNSLIVLDVAYNYLTTLKEKGYETQLPETLEILSCSYNRLKTLDLFSTKKLKELNCSNNPQLKLYHVPDGVIRGQYDSVLVHAKPRDELDYTTLDDDY